MDAPYLKWDITKMTVFYWISYCTYYCMAITFLSNLLYFKYKSTFNRCIHHTYCIHLNMKLHVNVKCIYKNCVDSWFPVECLYSGEHCYKLLLAVINLFPVKIEHWELWILSFVNPAEILKTLSGNFRIWDMDSSYTSVHNFGIQYNKTFIMSFKRFSDIF